MIGHITVEALDGATSVEIFSAEDSYAINAPVSGVPTERMTMWFRAGSLPGLYTATLKLNGGNEVVMEVFATQE